MVIGPPAPDTLFLRVWSRFLLGVPIIAYFLYSLYERVTQGKTAWWQLSLLIGISAVYLHFMFLLIRQLQLVHSLRFVIAEEGLFVFRRRGSRTQLMILGWEELDLPTRHNRYGWIRLLSCFLGPLHGLHFLLPELLPEIRFRSLGPSLAKGVRFPVTLGHDEERKLLSWLSAFALPYWLARRQVQRLPSYEPSPERRLLRLDLERAVLRVDPLESEPETTKPKAEVPVEPSPLLLAEQGSSSDPEQEPPHELGVAYQNGDYLLADWEMPTGAQLMEEMMEEISKAREEVIVEEKQPFPFEINEEEDSA